MGHERLGALPRTARWRAVVGLISGSEFPSDIAAEVADATLTNVRRRFEGLADEDSVLAAFRFLIALPLATRTLDPQATLLSDSGIGVGGPPSPLALAKAFQASLEELPHAEHSDLAAKALADALSRYSLEPQFRQASMFESGPWDTWREADTAAGFCELSRLYFASLTERYLRYFLDREASAALGDPQRVTDFRSSLRLRVDSISRHAFETAKIAQSFAAGWFQKHAKGGMPPEQDIRGFLSYALHKIREELRREVGNG
jgi:phytoene dehydrogenase-like protein